MLLDDEMNLEDAVRKHKKQGKGLFSATRIFMVFLLVFGFIAGLFVQHQFVEPVISNSVSALNTCLSSNKLLNQELDACYTKLQLQQQQQDANTQT